MKICRYLIDNQIGYGIFENDSVYPTEESKIFNFDFTHSENFYSKDDVIFLPPVNPSKIVCVGRNYAAHAAELGNEIPQEPLLFLKAPTSLVRDSDPIEIPKQSGQVEHEGELAVVMRRDCKNLTANDHYSDYILGYTCLNDVTARDLQRKDIQFTRAKSFDTFCPVGLFIETDVDISDLRITTKVNDIIKQDGRTSQMIFSIPFLIEYISNQMTLKAGDIIATGTPSGVSKLESGDVCQIEIEGVGILENPVL